eukprot:g2893.t1
MGMVTNSFNSASSLLSNMDKPAFMMEMTGKGSLDARSQLAELAGHLGESYVADHVWSLVALQREEKMNALAQSGNGQRETSKCGEEQKLGQSIKETATAEHEVKKTSDAHLVSDDVMHKKLSLGSLQAENPAGGPICHNNAENTIGTLSVECASRILSPNKSIFLSNELLSLHVTSPVIPIFNLLVADAVAGFRLQSTSVQDCSPNTQIGSPILGVRAQKWFYDLLYGYENHVAQQSLRGQDKPRDIETKLAQTGLEKGADQNEFVVHASTVLLKLLNMLPLQNPESKKIVSDQTLHPSRSRSHYVPGLRSSYEHHGFCSALRNLSSHYFGMTIAAIQVDQERIASAMAMADAAGVDLSKTPAARSFDGSGKGVGSEDSALTNIAQSRAVLLLFETGLKLLRVEAAACTSGIASTGMTQAFPVTELGRCVWWLIHPVDGLVYESMKILDGIYTDHIVMHSGPSNVLQTAKALLSFGPTSSSPLLQHDISEITGPSYNGFVPRSYEELLSLRGVGPKIAHLLRSVSFGLDSTGIVVDTHVHRIATTLGWVEGGKSTPEDTRVALEKWVPSGEWTKFTLSVVGFGQATRRVDFEKDFLQFAKAQMQISPGVDDDDNPGSSSVVSTAHDIIKRLRAGRKLKCPWDNSS